MIKCTICKIMWKKIKNYFLDIKKIFNPLFIKNNYHKHLFYSFLITIPTILVMLNYVDLANTGLFFQIFIGGFGAFFVNFIREWYYGKYHNSPYDGTDINMGSYGGITGTIVAIIIYKLF